MEAVELRDRVIAPCSVHDPVSGRTTGGDVGALLLNVLLFEETVIDSAYLREFPDLVHALGAQQLVLLLEHGGLSIKCDARTLGENGESPRFPGRSRRGPLPPGTYCFNLGWDVPPREFFGNALSELARDLTGWISAEDISSLTEAIERRFIPLPEDFGHDSMQQLERDLSAAHDQLFRAAIAHAARTELSASHNDLAGLWLEVVPIGDGAFQTATNLSSYGFDEKARHDLVRSALFAIGGLNFRFEEMRAFNGVSGFQPDELPLFEGKLAFLWREIAPEVQAERFRKIITVAGLPDFEAAVHQGQAIDVERLLDARAGDECREFRLWLRTLNCFERDEINERVNSLRAKVAGIARRGGTRALRFGAVTATGAIPGIGLPVSAGLGVLDAFVVDRLLGKPGPAAFLDRHYKAILSY